MWQGILGHDDVVEQFRRTLASGRLASTYLFVGPPGVGKRRFAIELAHSLLCTESEEAAFEPCEKCDSCRMFAAGNHPDLELIGLPTDKSTLPIASTAIRKVFVLGLGCDLSLDGERLQLLMMLITSGLQAPIAC